MALVVQHLRQERSALMGWTAAVALMAFGLAALYALIPPGFATQAKPFMHDLPAGLSTFVGGVATFLSAQGWITGMALSGFVPLTIAIFVALGTLSVVVEDRETGRLGFLLALPVTRHRLVASRALSLFAQICVVEGALWLATLLGLAVIGHSIPAGRLAVAVVPGLLAQTALAGTLVLIGLALKDETQAMLVALAVTLLLSLLPALADRSAARFLSPFAYASARAFLSGGGFPAGHVALLALWTVMAFALTIGLFARMDA